MHHFPTAEQRPAFFHLFGAAAIATILMILTVVVTIMLGNSDMADVQNYSLNLFGTILLFVAQDRLVAIATALAIAASVIFALRARSFGFTVTSPRNLSLAVLTGFLAAFVSGVAVFHGYNLTLDEFMPEFQAAIFREGLLMAPLDARALEFHSSLQPFFTYVREDFALWSSYYRPVHGALLAIIPEIMGFSLLNPMLSAISILAMADICKRAFPDHPETPLLGATLLLLSPQFIVTAGSGFAFPAHLAFNLVWLSFFLRGVFWAHCVAATIGAFAIGLHQVHVHPIYAAPFLVGLLFGQFGSRFNFLPYLVLYAVALPIWVCWPEIALWLQTGDATVLPRAITEVDYILNYLRYATVAANVEGPFEGVFLLVNILRYLLWISPALVLLLCFALLRIRHIGRIAGFALLSILLTIGLNHLAMANQAQTWGARYYHPVLGNMVLLGVAAYVIALKTEVGAILSRATMALLVLSAIVFVPWRMLQTEEKVGPRAQVQAELAKIDVDVLAVPSLPIIYNSDMVRNDPFLRNRPIMLSLRRDPNVSSFGEDSVKVLTVEDLNNFGLPSGTLYEPGER